MLILALATAACGDDDAVAPDDDGGSEADAASEPPIDAAIDPVVDAALPIDAAVEPTIVSIGAGNSVACAVISTGQVRCWGANDQGQVGAGERGMPLMVPTDVVGLTSAVTVDCGTAHCCARTSTGGAECWGWNAAGELGANRVEAELPYRASPAAAMLQPPEGPPAELEDVAQISVGGAHNCALQGGAVSCWGWNAAGQGGLLPPPKGIERVIAARPTGITDVVALALARPFLAEHSCAITATGDVVCWGLNNNGQLGDGGTATRHTAQPVTGLASASAIVAGQQHTCAIARSTAAPKSPPGVYCWGLNNLGQAGPNAVTPQTTPVEVPGLAGAVALAAGVSHTCAVLDTGAARCWGANNFGQLGRDSVAEGAFPDPSDVVGTTGAGGLSGVVELSGGFGNTCARTATGEVYCWGQNHVGQLGQGAAGPDVPRPVEVLVLPDAP
ncbi:MAG TPA: hypothetical protein VNO33_23205 [Kofleriaceae bacterium]|nr:hypothetical protein [Kofleriaceae bacterium]